MVSRAIIYYDSTSSGRQQDNSAFQEHSDIGTFVRYVNIGFSLCFKASLILFFLHDVPELIQRSNQPVPLKYPLQLAHVSPDSDLWYKESLENPDRFWGDLARTHLTWMKEFNQVMDCDMRNGKIKWFTGGKLNVTGIYIYFLDISYQHNVQHIAIFRYYTLTILHTSYSQLP